MTCSTFAWESDMRLAAIGLTFVCFFTNGAIGQADAFQSGSNIVVIGKSHHQRTTLGAPLYAGPTVVIVGGGSTYYGKPLGYGRRGYGRHRIGPRHKFGLSYPYGYRWRGPRYGYNLYWGNPYAYGNRYPYRHYGYVNPYPVPLYRGGRGYGREGYDRSPRLTILGATYRSIDGRACDAFSFVHRRCDGERSCSVKANNNICGDPDRGRLKVLEVVYACGYQQLRANVPERSRSRLGCR